MPNQATRRAQRARAEKDTLFGPLSRVDTEHREKREREEAEKMSLGATAQAAPQGCEGCVDVDALGAQLSRLSTKEVR